MELVYVNMNGNHFKMWGFDLFQNTTTGQTDMISYWGRIGVSMSKLQKKTKPFKTYADAYDYAWAKMREKQDKGYWTMPNSQYFDVINMEKPLFQLINLINCYKKDNDFLTTNHKWLKLFNVTKDETCRALALQVAGNCQLDKSQH